MPSSIIDFNFASVIFPGGQDLRLPTPSSNKTQPPGWFNQKSYCIKQYLKSEEVQNPVSDKLTLRSRGKMTSLYVQYCRTDTDRKGQLTDRTLHKNKLNQNLENSLPLFFNSFDSLFFLSYQHHLITSNLHLSAIHGLC